MGKPPAASAGAAEVEDEEEDVDETDERMPTTLLGAGVAQPLASSPPREEVVAPALPVSPRRRREGRPRHSICVQRGGTPPCWRRSAEGSSPQPGQQPQHQRSRAWRHRSRPAAGNSRCRLLQPHL